MGERSRRKARAHGEGTVRQRADGRWEARVTIAWDGARQIRRSFYGKTEREAVRKMHEALARLRQGVPVGPEQETIRSYLTRWLEETARPRVAPRTYETYEMICRAHLIPALGRIKLVQLTPQHVQRYMNDKRAAGLSARTVAGHRAVLRKALNDAMAWGLVSRNVAALASPPRIEKSQRRYLTPDDARYLLQAIQGHRLEPLIIVALGLGLRQAEVLGLRWDDIDEAAGVVRPTMQVQRIKGQGLVLRELKTQTSQKPLPLSDLVRTALRKQRAMVAEMRLAAGPAWREHGLIFPSTVGTPQEPRNLTRAWHRLRRQIGMEWLGMHGLRHGLGSLLAAQGVHPRVAMELMRHSQFSLTMEIYTHVAPDLAREAVDEIDRILRA